MNITIRAFTHPAGRPSNEDCFALLAYNTPVLGERNMATDFSVSSSSLFPCTVAVFDGVGGYKNGYNSSKFAATETLRKLGEDLPPDVDEMISEINSSLCQNSGHGYTTATLLQIKEGCASYLSCGDSRLYLIRNHQFTQLTADDNTSDILENIFHLSPKEARIRSRLTKCLGMDTLRLSKPKQIIVLKGDIFVLVTDGCTAILEDLADADTLEEMLNDESPDKALYDFVRNHIYNDEISDNVTIVTAAIMPFRTDQ